MNWLHTQMTLLDAATAAVGFGVNWFLQSTMLITIGLAVGRLLRQRGAAVQSAVYRTTLAAVIICPIASWMLSVAGVSGWSIAMPQPWTYEQTKVIIADAALSVVESPPTSLPAVVDAALPAPLPGASGELQLSLSEALPVDARASQSIGPVDGEVLSPVIAAQSIPNPGAAAEGIWTFSVHVSGWLALGIDGAWLLISTVLLARLATAWWRLSRLCRGAAQANALTRQACHELASQLAVSTPEVLRSPYLPSPCLAGLRRPAVLLPEGELSLSVRDVLIHELAHLARRDCHWNLLRQLALSVFFFQPLLWKLSRRLETTAEEVCDDYVVEYGGDRQEYAHRLVDIAELSTAPMAAAGVGIVSLRSMLAQRVQRIMDTSRSLSTRVGSLLLTLVLAGGLIGTMIVGLVGIGPQRSVAEVASQPTENKITDGDQEAKDDSTTDTKVSGADGFITVRGQVVDPEGKPFADAVVLATRWASHFPNERRSLAQVKSDAEGRFEIRFRKSTYIGDLTGVNQWQDTSIVAIAASFGTGFVRHHELAGGEATLWLAADEPIEGRVVDLEGRPKPGVKVQVTSIAYRSSGDLTPWLEALRRGESYFDAAEQYGTDHAIATDFAPLAITAETGADGRFRLQGVGKNRTAGLRIEGGGIVTADLQVVTVSTEPIPMKFLNRPTPFFNRTETLYGTNFQYAAEPSQPVTGVVRDAKTHEPLTGVRVLAYQFAGKKMHEMSPREAISDERGRYRLDGMPKGEGNRVQVILADGQPYFTRKFTVPVGTGLEPIALDLDMVRGVLIHGRLTNKATAEAIGDARMQYIPWPSNPRLKDLPERVFKEGEEDRYLSDREGRFTVVGLPGRGLLTANLYHRPFPTGQGVREIADLPADGAFLKVSRFPAPSEQSPTALREVNPGENDQEFTADLALDSGERLNVKIVDPQGMPLSGLTIRGLWPPAVWHIPENVGPEVTVEGLGSGEKRWLLVSHPLRKLGKAIRVTTEDAAKGTLTVVAEPCATITARLHNDADDPVRDGFVFFKLAGERNYPAELPDMAIDKDGSFTNKQVLPGCQYNVTMNAPGIEFKTVARNLSVKPGETIDLGEFDVTKEERPEPKRTAAQKTAAADGAAAVKVDTEQQTAADDASDRLEFAGTVVDPKGKPMAAAKIYLLYYTPTNVETRPLGQTDASGTFDFAVSKRDFDTGEMNDPWQAAYVVAVVDGHGLEAASATSFEKSGALLAAMRAKPNFSEKFANLAADRTLRLVADDVPIEGRVLNLEGQPVAGVTIQVLEIHLNRENTLDPWLNAVENEKADFYQAREHVMHGFHGRHLSSQVSQLFPKVVTGAKGQFRIDGIGRERIVLMQIQGPGIETRQVYSRTRPGAALRVIGERRDPELGSYTFYPATFDFPAAPSRPVVGVVRDVDSGKPLADVTVQAQRLAGERTSGWSNHYIHAKTDAEGHYRLEGLPIGESEVMAATKGEEPYLLASLSVETRPTRDTTTLDFKLKRGVRIRGRVTDSATGKPLRARVEYFAFDGNPNIKAAPGLMGAWDFFRTTDADGRFVVPGLPGRGLIGVLADNHQDYPRGVGAEDIKGGRADDQGMILNTSPYRAVASNFHHLVEVNPAMGADSVECAIALVAGKRLDGTVLDPEGKPLPGAMFAGENGFKYFTPLGNASFAVRNLQPDEPRRIQFYHKERKLAGSALITGDETGPLSVNLAPWGVITGRVLDEAGLPAEKVTIGSGNYEHQVIGLIAGWQEPWRMQTDDNGRFRIEGLAPGLDYSLMATKDSRFLGTLGDTFQVSAGETKELGDLTIHPSPDPSNRKRPTNSIKNNVSQAAPKVDFGDRVNFAGKVVDSSGKPVRGAKIFMIRLDYIALSAVPLKPLAETQADGTFEFTAAGKDFHPLDAYVHWGFTPLVATADGHAIFWGAAAGFESSGALLKELRADPDLSERASALAGDGTLRLPDDDLPIEGRIINLEGLPIAAARVKVIEIRDFARMSLDAWIKLAQSKISASSPELWRGVDELNLGEQVRQLFPEVATGADGRFRIDGIGPERVVRLQIEAPATETRRVYVRTQRGGAINVGDGSGGLYSGDKTIYAASFEFPIGPSRPVTGVVRDVDTQKPLSGVTIQIQEMAGDPAQVWPKESLRTTTDAEGRYSVTGLPIGENSLMALPPFDQPYMLAEQKCDTGQAKESLQLDFNLKRGVWVRGRVTDGATGQGVRADVEYYAPLDNPHQKAMPSFWGASWRPHLTDAEGRFAIPAFPGRGLIAIRAHDYRAYPIGVGADKIAGGKFEDGVTSIVFRTNPLTLTANDHSAIKEINPSEGVDASDIDFVLKPGKSLAGTVLDPEGQPLTGAKFSGEVEQTTRWKPLKDTSFAVRNLQPSKARRLLFVHEQRQLAGTMLLAGEESGLLSVKLEPWGAISGRALDKNGEPLRAVHLVPFFKVGQELHAGGQPPPTSWPTDEEGRFTITALVPGVDYLFRVLSSTRDRYIGIVAEDVRVSSGEAKDLGDVTLNTSK